MVRKRRLGNRLLQPGRAEAPPVVVFEDTAFSRAAAAELILSQGRTAYLTSGFFPTTSGGSRILPTRDFCS